ncbi:MAG: alpha/beta fold hydrolase [Deltaproteobacteria bacterium]|nr:alpha/beta fold hydrolase [Deltaproteobacteria bacterium]
MSAKSDTRLFNGLMVIALALILVGGFLAYMVQTGGGDIKVRDLRFVGHDGKLVSALLYVPKGVDKKHPAPGIVATHGYINSRETQDGFAIEFARRGYVVLAPDQSGHGYSDPPAFANAFGGADSLPYLHSLDIVDKDNIGLEGHSMGGWASIIAAAMYPQQYQSIVITSSSPGTYGAPEGTPNFPRNAALIYSTYDEFSQLMWGIPVPGDIVKTDKLKKFFGTTETVEVGKLYGSIEEGTARKLFQPPLIHPRTHFCTESIGNAVEWVQATLKGGKDIPPSDQTWYWKEFGTLIAMIGMVLMLFPLGKYLLGTEFFEELNEAPAERKALSGWGWWVAVVITLILPVLFYMKSWDFLDKGILKPSAFWPQQITNVLIFWAVAVGVSTLILLLLWHFISNKKAGATMANYGLTWQDGIKWVKIGKSFLLAFIVVFFAHLTLAISDWLFLTDYRFWVFAIKPLDFFHFLMALAYVIPFAFYMIIASMLLHGQLCRNGNRGNEVSWKDMVINVVIMIGGYILYFIYQYVPLFAGGSLAVTTRWSPLYSIVLFQFVPIFTIVALVSTYFYRKTGHVYVGAFLNAMLVSWIVVAGQATHYAF